MIKYPPAILQSHVAGAAYLADMMKKHGATATQATRIGNKLLLRIGGKTHQYSYLLRASND